MFIRSKKCKIFFLIFLVFLLGLLLGREGGIFPVSAATEETYKSLKIFTQVLDLIQKSYVEEVTPEDLVYGAINGMLGTLDPHSSFMPPDVYKELQVETKGSFGGLGIEITIKEGVLIVVSPIEGTPAFKAGIKSGDQIIKIEGKLTKNMTLMDAVKKMRGPKGTKITISVMRKGFTGLRDITIIRDIINIQSVKSKVLEGGYGYIRLATFQEKTEKDLEKALNELESMEGGLKGLILDLRNNPGGLLKQAVKVGDAFLDSGLIVYTDGRIESQKMRFKAKKGGAHVGFPLVVLVNEGSASASEIIAGALQDHGRAVILGTQTFGKGSVQTIIPLEDGSGLKLTTGRYYTPKGKSIQAKGILPDVLVEDTEKIAGINTRRHFREEDLEGHLNGDELDLKEKTDSSEGGVKSPKEIRDVQMERALDLLKTWNIFSRLPSSEFSPREEKIKRIERQD
jgi:carboxyl-terminal processing protease